MKKTVQQTQYHSAGLHISNKFSQKHSSKEKSLYRSIVLFSGSFVNGLLLAYGNMQNESTCKICCFYEQQVQ
jgi:hypothetical protein